MKKTILTVFIACTVAASAQNNTAYNVIEGSKTLLEFVRVFKTPRNSMPASAALRAVDSCDAKSITDFCAKNNSDKILIVSLYKRTGDSYETAALTMRILPRTKEWLYELRSGVYKIKAEIEEEEGEHKPFKEGEIRLNPCRNPVKVFQD